MQPTNNDVPPGELPRPQYEYEPQAPAHEQGPAPIESQHGQSIEKGTGAPAAQPDPAATQSATPPPLPTIPNMPAADPLAPAAGSTASNMPQIADDSDLIEKEWVTKAKEIVEKTKDNPYQQTKEIHQMKADYLKKRYAKDLKLQEE